MYNQKDANLLGEIIGNNRSVNENVDYLEGDKTKSIEEVMQDATLTQEQKSAIISYMKISTVNPYLKSIQNLINEVLA